VRRIEFLKDLELSILSQRRGPYPPFGLQGGSPGALGENIITRDGGAVERLGGLVQLNVHRDDVLTIMTPGGGGFGEK
jgi:5-oxoprolinase (ATP-hydrolysing)